MSVSTMMSETKPISIKEALRTDDIAIMHRFLSAEYRLGTIDKKGSTVLHKAMNQMAFNILKISKIFFAFQEDINYTDDSGLSHMHIASAFGNLDVVKYFLIEKGEDVNLKCSWHKFYRDFTPLHFAAKFENIQVGRYLLDNGADVEAVDCSGRTALHIACIGQENWEDLTVKYVKYFINSAEYQDIEFVKMLMVYKELINAKDWRGRTPLLYLFESQLFKTNDFHDHSAKGYKIHDAIAILTKSRERLLKKLELLLNHGADISIVGDDKIGVLHRAIMNLKTTRFPYYLSTTLCFNDTPIAKAIELLLAKGADIEAKNSEGQTPLQMAVMCMSSEVVKVLLQNGADINSVVFDYNADRFFNYNVELRPCLESVENVLDIIELLSDKGYEFSLQDKLVILKFLVRHGDASDFSGSMYTRTKLDNLLHYGTPSVISKALEELEPSRQINFRNAYIHYRKFMSLGNFHVDFKLSLRKSRDDGWIKRCTILEAEERMKNINVTTKFTLEDLMRMRPSEIYHQLEAGDYRRITRDRNFEKSFCCFHSIVKGHFAKSITRKYVLSSAIDYFRFIAPKSLPVECIIMILEKLKNEELLDVCLSAHPLLTD